MSFPAEVSSKEENKVLVEKKQQKYREIVIKDDIEKYFKDIFTGFIEYYKAQYGYLPSEKEPVKSFMKFWDKLEARNKQFLNVDFEGRDNFQNLLGEFY